MLLNAYLYIVTFITIWSTIYFAFPSIRSDYEGIGFGVSAPALTLLCVTEDIG